MADLKVFLQNIWKSLVRPTGSIYFWVYLVWCVIFIGSFGIWILFFKNSVANTQSIDFAANSFSLVLLISSGVDILLREDSNKNGMNVLSLLAVCIFPFTILVLVFLFPSGHISRIFAVIFYIISILVWWIANGDKKVFTGQIYDMEDVEKRVELAKPKR